VSARIWGERTAGVDLNGDMLSHQNV
jgi:hypothetical protein